MPFKHYSRLLIFILILCACEASEKNGETTNSEKVEVIKPTNDIQGRINGNFNGCGFDKETETGSLLSMVFIVR